jgi:flagellar assembly factor FliW
MNAHALVLDSPKLGEVPYDPADVIRFAEGLPGFEHLRDFLVVTRQECAPFVFLASIEAPAVALPLLPLGLVGDSTAVGAVTDAAAFLRRDADSMLAAYAVVSIGREARSMIANLRAPVVIDLDARRGAQVILGDESLPVAASIGG